MFGLIKRKELNEVKRDIKEDFEFLRDKTLEYKGNVKTLNEKLKLVCTHVRVKEIVSRYSTFTSDIYLESTMSNKFECMACEKLFVEKPKGSKISRMKEVLSEK